MSNRQVAKQGYQLVNARYDLNPFEMKLILNALTEIKMEDRQFFSRRISVKQLERELKVQINPTQLKEQCIELFKKPIHIPKKGKGFLIASWFATIEYFEDKHELEYEISPKLAPYLLELKGRITKTHLQYILPMKSFYSMRIYTLLKEYERIGSRTFVVSELQELLNVGESLKERYNNFKKYVLNQAIKDINKTDIFIELEESKKERKKVIEITFKIKGSAMQIQDEHLKELYKGRKIVINAEHTIIEDITNKDGHISAIVKINGTPTRVDFETQEKFMHCLDIAERTESLF